MITVGSKVFVKNYGKGVVQKIDSSDKSFMYLVRFSDRGKTLAWLPKDTKFNKNKEQ